MLQCCGQDCAADEAGGGHPRLRGHHEQQEPQACQRLSSLTIRTIGTIVPAAKLHTQAQVGQSSAQYPNILLPLTYL